MGDGRLVHVSIHGVAEMRVAFRQLPKEANQALREHTWDLAQDLADRVRSAATAAGRQSAAVAKTVKAKRDRVPVVTAGGSQRVTRQRRRSRGQDATKAADLVFGANFGASHLKQFAPHRGAGSDDYWFFSTIEREQGRVDEAWNRVLDDVVSQWGGG